MSSVGADRRAPRSPRSLRGMLANVAARVVPDNRVDPVVVGRLLLVSQGAFVLLSAPLIHPVAAGWRALIVVSTVMTVLLAASFRVRWDELPRLATLFFPISTMAALAVLSLTDHGTFAPFTGFLTLSFGYIGLTQAQHTGLFVMPFALATYTLAYGLLSGELLVRLVIACGVWTLIAELLAWLTGRYVSLTEELRRAAFQDALTGGPDRRDLESHLAATTEQDMVVICDLDHFKRVNDTLGHAMGDHVLADFGALLRAELRATDYFARYGGEEFVLILGDATAAARERMLTRLHERWSLLQPAVTFSSGSAQFASDRTPVETLALADRALYEAKAAGRNTDRVAAGLDARR